MRLLVLAPRFPYPLDRGDRLTVFNLLRHFSERHRVALVCFVEPGQKPGDRAHFEKWVEKIYTAPLRRSAAYAHCLLGALSSRPLQASYYRSGEMFRTVRRAVEEFRPDLVYAHTIRMADYGVVGDVRPRVLAMQVAMTLNYRRLAAYARDPLWKTLYTLEHRKVLGYEPRIAARYDRVLLISPADVAALEEGGGVKNALLSPHGVDFGHFRPDPWVTKVPGRLVFTGNMGYRPNVDAVSWFVREILPLVRRQVPGVSLSVVGTRPSRAVRGLARDPALEVTGRVPDLLVHLNQAEVGIDPLRIGAGLQNKVLEGMAAALPMVVTSTANEGIRAKAGEHLLVADEPVAFARAVVQLLQDPDLRSALGARARRFIVGHWSWEAHFNELERELVRLVETQRAGNGK